MTVVTLVSGGSGAAREHAIAAHVDPQILNAAIIEGLADGQALLETATEGLPLQVVRVAPGCPCCIGNLTMRVTLNRLLRQAPAHLYLSIVDASHKSSIVAFLQGGQYQEHLQLGPELVCS
jgi:hypothetical protein